MHVLVDAQAVQSPATRERGIGRYSRSLITALAVARPSWDIEIVESEHLDPPALGRAFPRIPVRRFLPPLPAELANAAANERYYADWLTAQCPDAILLLNCFDSATLAPKFRAWRPRLLTVLYDLSQLVFHRRYLQGERVLTTYGERLRMLLASDRILTLSEATAHDLQLATDGEMPPVEVICGAADPAFVPFCDNDLNRYRGQLAKEYDLDREFLLCVGGGDFRKNIPGVVEAFATLPADQRERCLLAVAGRFAPDQLQSLRELAGRLGVEKSLRLIGFVPDDLLCALYQLCRLVLFPSLHEGLGLPVLEALQCGAPVVASDCSAIPEYAGNVCRLADPLKPEEFGRQIELARSRGSRCRPKRAPGACRPLYLAADGGARLPRDRDAGSVTALGGTTTARRLGVAVAAGPIRHCRLFCGTPSESG